MDAFVLIGSANTRKSSICRSLTGCFNRSYRDILATNNNTLDIYARVSSLQESETTPADFYQEASNTRQNNVLFALWPNAHTKKPTLYPDADTYLQYFQQQGWNIRKIAILGSNNNMLSTTFATGVLQTFPNTRADPINLSSMNVRNHFNWI